jgi:phage terminase small subunit
MAKLTARQESFAQAVASGMNQSDAYRKAYSADKTSDKVIWINASKVAKNDKVLLRIDELKAELASKFLWTREMSVKVLANIAAAKVGFKGGEKVSAVRELNLMHGFNQPIKIDNTSGDKTITIIRATKPV